MDFLHPVLIQFLRAYSELKSKIIPYSFCMQRQIVHEFIDYLSSM